MNVYFGLNLDLLDSLSQTQRTNLVAAREYFVPKNKLEMLYPAKHPNKQLTNN